jgi:hypothetical protein
MRALMVRRNSSMAESRRKTVITTENTEERVRDLARSARKPTSVISVPSVVDS